jgi:hypothetical protein
MVVPVQRIAQLGVQARSARDAVLRVVEMLKELHATIELPQGLFEHLANAVGAHEAAEAVLAAVIKENAAPSVVE